MKRWTAQAVGAILVLLVTLTVGQLVAHRPVYALIVAACALAVGLAAFNHALVAVAAVPLLLVVARVSGGGVDVSLSDVALAGAAVPAVLLSRGLSQPMRRILVLIVVYLAATLFTVVANPYALNAVEWAHAAVLLWGALMVGWSIGRAGMASAGLTLFLLTASTIAALTVIVGVSDLIDGSLTPVFLTWPFNMHKNYIGATLGLAAVVAYVRPPWMRWSGPSALAVFMLLSAGVVFSQSRQAIVGLGVALVVLVLRSDAGRRRSKAVLFAVVPALLYVWTVVVEQASSDNEFNSVNQRFAWYRDAIEVWRTSPLVGVGLRWWHTDRFEYRFQPPNAELEVLTSAGIVGLVAFLALMGGTLGILWRLPQEYGMLAVLIVLCRLVQAQFDLFWTAVHASVPFLVVGICLGALAWSQENCEPAPAVSVTTKETKIREVVQ